MMKEKEERNSLGKEPPPTPPVLFRRFMRLLDREQARYGREEGTRRAIKAMTVITTQNGCTEDEIPGAYGEFGMCETNPVPVHGIASGYDYLERLRTLDGGKVTVKRLGSFNSPISNMPIDRYRIFNAEHEAIATVDLSPYHRKTSKKAPKGFMLVEEPAKA